MSEQKNEEPEPPHDIMDTLAELREISAGVWDVIDPDEYIRNLRGEPEMEAELSRLQAENAELRKQVIPWKPGGARCGELPNLVREPRQFLTMTGGVLGIVSLNSRDEVYLRMPCSNSFEWWSRVDYFVPLSEIPVGEA